MAKDYLEQARAALLEIRDILVSDGTYSDHDHLLESMRDSGLSAKEILKGNKA